MRGQAGISSYARAVHVNNRRTVGEWTAAPQDDGCTGAAGDVGDVSDEKVRGFFTSDAPRGILPFLPQYVPHVPLSLTRTVSAWTKISGPECSMTTNARSLAHSAEHQGALG